ncbi:unnamed protein product [Tetraodon nigroviridis]|uniref:Chromosome 14 SCAF14660, whole genome shotgun sequence n=1 Tax=Tetraodon nigroviridis TaxID=99883 RepID=Q4SC58_TETNG|nr:unnamed protein product [Tetraodon nigroviridis]
MGNLCFGMSLGLGPKLDLDAVAAENQAFIKTRTSLRQLYEAQLKDLTRAVEQMRVQRVRKLKVNICKKP